MNRSTWRLIFISVLNMLAFIAPIAAASGLTYLYDGSLGSTPDQQGFIYQTFPPPPFVSATQTVSAGGVVLDTTPLITDYAGYFSRSNLMPALDRATGYTVCFTTQVLSEDHSDSDRNGDSRDDRAGFSLTILSSDSIGLELGF